MKVLLEYQQDWDENGLFFFLATRGGSQAWENPMASGQCIVEFYPELSWGCAEDVVASVPCGANGYMGTQDGSSVTFDISPSGLQLCPTHYTIRNAQDDFSVFAIRNWVFEGSTRDAQWTVLTTHNDDPSLAVTQNATATFAVPGVLLLVQASRDWKRR